MPFFSSAHCGERNRKRTMAKKKQWNVNKNCISFTTVVPYIVIRDCTIIVQRQVIDGGFQGRRNKPSDTCYAFW